MPRHAFSVLRQRLHLLTAVGSSRAALQAMRLLMLKVLLVFGSSAIGLIWIFESRTRHITRIDRIAYPIMETVYILSFLAIQFYPSLLARIEKISFGLLATYAIVYIQSLIYNPQLTDIYAVASFAQWFPLVYTAAYIFFETRQAMAIAVLIYVTLIASLLTGMAIDTDIWTSEKSLILFNMLCAHPVYIAVLSAFALVKISFVQAQSQAESMSIAASTDYLTGVLNRRAIAHKLQQALLEAQRASTRLTILLLDVDHFKSINDTFGHDMGDQALIEIAALLQQDLRATDALGRWGGEEFIVIAGQIDWPEAYHLGERLRGRIECHRSPGIGQITISCGIAVSLPEDTPESLIKRADLALYQAKHLGRNRVETAETAA